MKIKAEGVGVDSGMIMVADINYLKGIKHSKKELKMFGKIFDIPNGRYKVSYHIPESWNGKIDALEELEVAGGKIFIIDPCYTIGKPKHEDWIAWLNKTDYGKNLRSDKSFIIDSMGGDGEYVIELDLEKI